MTCDIGPVPQVSVSTKRCGFQSREQARRPRSGTEPSHHLNVVLSKAALSGPSVCLRARAPCPLRASCPVTDRAQSAQLCAPSRSGSRERAAQLHVLALPAAPWVKTSLCHRPTRAPPRSCSGTRVGTSLLARSSVMMILLLFLQKQNLAFAVYLLGSVLSLPD